MTEMKKVHIEMYEHLYELDENYVDSVEERIEKLRDKQISKYRTKTIKSGDMLEIEIYPINTALATGKRMKKNTSRGAQQNLNNKNAQKNLIRIVNANFTKDDIWITLTYDNAHLPADLDQAKKDMTNYIRRLQRYIKKHDMDELKYVYVTEYAESDTKKRVHHHMILNFKDRDAAEMLWKNGGRTQTRRLQPDDFGLTGMVKYIMKQKRNAHVKRYTPSRNLKKPKITVADNKITRRRAEKLAREQVVAEEVFQKMYKDYCFKDIEVKYSHYVSGAYIYVRMSKINPVQQKRRKDE